ncbi:hypothetical protein EVAR_65198_1 [Eumeta japonica]|uniref:Uncharacterized protein n=1 Tax=Eumeta variegata TaxID=151549 RepID=A0A4C1ZLT6_EUMVA|nr:hypothetical protein EVAR_65198_1 [Eumeta japonica]
MVIAPHENLQPQRSQQCVASLLGGNRISNEGKIGIMEGKMGVDYQNSYSLDEMQQLKVVFFMSVFCESTIFHESSRVGPFLWCNRSGYSMALPTDIFKNLSKVYGTVIRPLTEKVWPGGASAANFMYTRPLTVIRTPAMSNITNHIRRKKVKIGNERNDGMKLLLSIYRGIQLGLNINCKYQVT